MIDNVINCDCQLCDAGGEKEYASMGDAAAVGKSSSFEDEINVAINDVLDDFEIDVIVLGSEERVNTYIKLRKLLTKLGVGASRCAF